MGMQIVQIVYWLALSTWFGGALFIAIAWRIIFKTVNEANPILPTVLSVNLEGQHGTLLAGTIVGNLLATFQTIELVCCAVLAVALGGQAFLVNLSDRVTFSFVLVRGVLLALAALIILYDWRFVWPKLWQARQEFLDHADEPEKANPAKDRFDSFQRESVTLREMLLFLLLGMVLFSGAAGLAPAVHLNQPEQSHAAAPN
jgi:hypothetical protein